MPGNHVAMPDGRHVWEYFPKDGHADLGVLVKAAAGQVLPDAKLTASEQRAVAGDGARLVTTLTRHPGGASVQVHARIDESFTLVYDAIVSRDGQAAALPSAVATGTAVAEQVSAAPVVEEENDAEILSDHLTRGANLGAGFAKWSPDSGETVHDRLAAIVGGAMGYEPEDLPWEVPLIELGLDSLMAVRIKNRVEYDFDLPPIQLTAVRDANLYAVEKLIEYAIEHRDEVEELHEHQKTQTPEEIAAEQAAVMSGATPATVSVPTADPQAEPETQSDAPATETPIPPPPTDPSGPKANGAQPSAAAMAAQVLTQEAVTEALGSDVPPREAAERVTFATWAIVTGKSPGGIFNALPTVDDETAEKIAAAPHRARRGHHHRRRREELADDRSAGDHRSRAPRGGRPGRVRARAARAEGGFEGRPGVRVPPGGRFDRGVRAAAEPAACRHPDVRHRAGGGLRRGARRGVRAETARDA